MYGFRLKGSKNKDQNNLVIGDITYSMPGPISTWVGDCLWAGKQSGCETTS